MRNFKTILGLAKRLLAVSVAGAYLLLSMFVLFNSTSASAQGLQECTPAKLRALGVGILTCGSGDCSASSPAVGGGSGGVTGSVYIVGDSITVGADTSGALETAFSSSGLTIEDVNGVVGRSVTGGGDDGQSGLEAVDADSTSITNAAAVVVALGTNGGSGSDITNMINAINSIKTDVDIYWVNVFSPGAAGDRETFNRELDTRSRTVDSEFTVIDTTSAGINTTDSLHPDSDGQKIFSETIARALSGRTAKVTSSLGCSCSVTGASNGTTEENERQAWAYFTSTKGLSPEAAAGLMGGIADESGFNPHNTQNTAPAPDGPEIPIDIIRSRWGYGLIQWTSAGRQDGLVAYARETNRSTGDLGLQLDYLWKELSEGYTGPLATLQTPGISVQEASDEVTLHFITPGSVTREHGTAASRAATLRNRGAASQAYFDKFSGQTIVSSVGTGGCRNDGGKIDLVSADTTSIPCSGDSKDAGESDGYRMGKLYRIRLCDVGGTRVNSQISSAMSRLLADSAAAGVNISFGSFRAMEGCPNCQVEMYQTRCREQSLTPTPGPYPKASYSDYQKCDSIAPPGYSNHQMGLAIDVSCDGNLIPRYHPSAADNPCYQWLVANAAKYSLYEFGKGEGNKTSGSYEAWHWSVDGN